MSGAQTFDTEKKTETGRIYNSATPYGGGVIIDFHTISGKTRTQKRPPLRRPYLKSNKTPAEAFTPPADEK